MLAPLASNIDTISLFPRSAAISSGVGNVLPGCGHKPDKLSGKIVPRVTYERKGVAYLRHRIDVCPFFQQKRNHFLMVFRYSVS